MRFEVTAESRLAVAPLVRTGVAPVNDPAHDDVRSRIEAVEQQPCGDRPGVERRRAEIGQPVAGGNVRIDEDIGHSPGVEFAGERLDHLREERGDHRAVELLAAQRLQQAFERRTVVLVEAETADRDVVTHGLGLGAGDSGLEIGPVLSRSETGHDRAERVPAARRQRAGDQVGTVVDPPQHLIDAREVLLRDLAAVVDHAVDRRHRHPRHAGDVDDADRGMFVVGHGLRCSSALHRQSYAKFSKIASVCAHT